MENPVFKILDVDTLGRYYGYLKECHKIINLTPEGKERYIAIRRANLMELDISEMLLNELTRINKAKVYEEYKTSDQIKEECVR